MKSCSKKECCESVGGVEGNTPATKVLLASATGGQEQEEGEAGSHHICVRFPGSVGNETPRGGRGGGGHFQRMVVGPMAGAPNHEETLPQRGGGHQASRLRPLAGVPPHPGYPGQKRSAPLGGKHPKNRAARRHFSKNVKKNSPNPTCDPPLGVRPQTPWVLKEWGVGGAKVGQPPRLCGKKTEV